MSDDTKPAQRRPAYKSDLERKFAAAHRLPYEAARLKYQVERTYTPDFELGPNLFVETKGLYTAADRSKHLHIKRQHPNVRVLLVFQDPNRRLSRTSRTTYAAWCDTKNIPWLHIDDALKSTRAELLDRIKAAGRPA